MVTSCSRGGNASSKIGFPLNYDRDEASMWLSTRETSASNSYILRPKIWALLKVLASIPGKSVNTDFMSMKRWKRFESEGL